MLRRLYCPSAILGTLSSAFPEPGVVQNSPVGDSNSLPLEGEPEVERRSILWIWPKKSLLRTPIGQVHETVLAAEGYLLPVPPRLRSEAANCTAAGDTVAFSVSGLSPNHDSQGPLPAGGRTELILGVIDRPVGEIDR